MKAIIMKSFGGPEVLRPADVPRPEPGPSEILIRVVAASVNPVDYKIRTGAFRKEETHLPAVPGRDVSGVVEAAGKLIGGFKRGDEVYAYLAANSGGYAAFAVARQNEVAHKPASIDHLHAAAVPLAAVTAWQALFDHGRMQPGQRVLIHGAAGGVGHFAVQIAKAKGATIIATASAEDLDLLRNLGADQVIDHHAHAFEEEVRDIDLVIDLVGGEAQRKSWQVLKDGGTLISTIQPPSAAEAARRNARAEIFMAKPTTWMLTEIARMIDAGQVRVVVQKTYELDEAAKAQDELEHLHSAGKRVLVVAET
ncbi:MAG TPA: NADP-dependent oxidoreductase [Lacunisphaera sp.]|nr:NADP-dependent oxidoreductase [Lacunisphaera sp.]